MRKKNKLDFKIIIVLLIFIMQITINLLIKYKLFKNHIINEKKKRNENKNKIFKKFNYSELESYYLSEISSKYKTYINKEKRYIKQYLSLKSIPNLYNNSLYYQLKYNLLKHISKFEKKNFSEIKSFFVKRPINFGNLMIALNNIMNYCDFLNCTKIYLNNKYFWYFKNKIITEKYNISLINSSRINCHDSTIACISIYNSFYIRPFIIFPEIKFNIFKNEIKRNLPIVAINPNDLYIHIRSGDIFKIPHPYYAQPPFCFYQSILNNFKFRNIYLLSNNNNNPLIKKLLNDFPNIIFNKNPKEIDISYLSNAYYLISSISTFVEACIKINDNLKIVWEYDLIRSSEKILYLRYDFFYFPRQYIIYQMKPSKYYRNEMFVWRNTDHQKNVMFNENCKNDFKIIKPNIETLE